MSSEFCQGFHCEFCHQDFARKDSLERHKKNICSLTFYKCPSKGCNTTKQKKLNIKKHGKDVYSLLQRNPFGCQNSFENVS